MRGGRVDGRRRGRPWQPRGTTTCAREQDEREEEDERRGRGTYGVSHADEMLDIDFDFGLVFWLLGTNHGSGRAMGGSGVDEQ
jgi:hypothetical protein